MAFILVHKVLVELRVVSLIRVGKFLSIRKVEVEKSCRWLSVSVLRTNVYWCHLDIV